MRGSSGREGGGRWVGVGGEGSDGRERDGGKGGVRLIAGLCCVVLRR